MNIAFGGMESWSENNRSTRRTLDKYFNAQKLILFDPKPVAISEQKRDNVVNNYNSADSVREEEERIILGAWILGAIGIGATIFSMAA